MGERYHNGNDTYADNDHKVKRKDFDKKMEKVMEWYFKKKGWDIEKIFESEKSQIKNWDKIQEFIEIIKDYAGVHL